MTTGSPVRTVLVRHAPNDIVIGGRIGAEELDALAGRELTLARGVHAGAHQAIVLVVERTFGHHARPVRQLVYIQLGARVRRANK